MNSRFPSDSSSIRATSLIFGLTLLVFALYFISEVVTRGVMRALTPLAAFVAVAWIFSARSAWWIPVPIAVAVGGFIWAGFKIYLHEIAILMAFAALAPMVAFKVRVHGTGPVRVPKSLWLLFFYLVAHAAWAMVAAYYNGGAGISHLARSYMDALWAVLFALAYCMYGNIRHVRTVLILMFIVLIFRSAYAVYQYLYPGNVILRIFGSFLPIAPGRVSELRSISLLLIMLSCGFFFTTRNGIFKMVCLAVMGASAGLVLLGGSRVSLIMVLLVPFVALAARRQFLLLVVMGSIAAFSIAILNLFPGIAENTPRFMERALSSLIFTRELDIHLSLTMSNDWHYYLMHLGFERWTQNPFTMLFGTSIEPFSEDYIAYTANFYDQAEIAAKTARYESALWSVLAPFGITGLLIYASIFWQLLRDPVRALFRDGLKSVQSIIYFCAFCHILLYTTFCWISGGFPGLELVWAVLAKAMYDDRWLTQRDAEMLANKPTFALKRRVTAMFQPD